MRKLFFVCIALQLLAGSLVAQKVATPGSEEVRPRVFLLDANHMEETRRRVRGGDKAFAEALAHLEREAKKALSVVPFSVVAKEIAPPSGDKHDYMSQAPYFWPDPKSANGLPYIRRDGERNPEINKISDRQNIARLISAVETLAVAYYLKGDEAYAAKATELLRVWFLNPDTRMNPNFQFAQGIPGITTGRGIGLIETSGLTQVVDAVGLLAGSKAWTGADQRALEGWFGSFLKWMQESKNGRDEAAAKNNHGTHYDMQVASFALFLGKNDIARDVLQTARQKRIAIQVEPDGRQPLELARTKAFSYSVMNLRGLMSLARLGEHVGVDLWNYQTADGRSIRRALDFLTPIALGEQKWTYQQLGAWEPEILFPLLRRAATKYPEGPYRQVVLKLPQDVPDRRSLLQVSRTP